MSGFCCSANVDIICRIRVNEPRLRVLQFTAMSVEVSHNANPSAEKLVSSWLFLLKSPKRVPPYSESGVLPTALRHRCVVEDWKNVEAWGQLEVFGVGGFG